MGIYKRKQESKKTRFEPRKRTRKKEKRKKTRSRPRKRIWKKDNGQEKEKENTLSTKKATKKKEKLSYFFRAFLFSYK